MRFLPVACCVVVLAAGCSTRGSTHQAIQSRYVGHDVVTVIHRLGYPTADRTVAGRHVLSWQRTTTYSGVALDKTGHATPQPPVQLPCLIDMEVDGLMKVTAVHVDGSIAACERFAD